MINQPMLESVPENELVEIPLDSDIELDGEVIGKEQIRIILENNSENQTDEDEINRINRMNLQRETSNRVYTIFIATLFSFFYPIIGLFFICIYFIMYGIPRTKGEIYALFFLALTTVSTIFVFYYT